MSNYALSWEWGPSNSRAARFLLYLWEGVFGGAIIVGLSLLWNALDWILSIVGLLTVFLLFWIWRARRQGRSLWNAEQGKESRIFQEWTSTRKWRWSIISSLIIGIVFLRIWGTEWHVSSLWLFYVINMGTFSLARIVCASGTVYPQERRLIISDQEANLDQLLNVRQLTVGGRAFLLLSFAESPEGGGQWRILFLPTAILSEIEPILHTDQATRSERSATVRSSRTIIRGILGLIAVCGVSFVALIYFGGSVAQLSEIGRAHV